MRALTAALTLSLVAACGGEDEGASPSPDAAPTGADAGPDMDPDAGPPAPGLTVEVARVPGEGLDAFTLTATLTGIEGPPTLELARGNAAGPTALGDGRYRFTVTPEGTGEHGFTVSAGDHPLTRIALVLPEIAEGWGQPMSVPGLANTAGYEDGVTITPDGEHLFVQTGPHYFSGFFVFNIPRDQGGCGGDRLSPDRCEHPWVNETIGSYGPPARPGFFDGRIYEDGALRHNSHLYQVPDDGAPNLAPITMFYGLKRQPEGHFAEPFYVAFEDGGDAIANPFGLSFQVHGDGTATTLFAFNDPTDSPSITGVDVDGDGVEDVVDSGFDVFTTTITLGQDNVLGQLLPGDRPLQIVRGDFPPRRVGFGDVGPDGSFGTQGNPHLFYTEAGEIHSVWTDDEYDADPVSPSHDDHGDLSVYLLDGQWPEGPFTKVALPDPVNTDAEEIQPFFDGETLYFTRDTSVLAARFDGPLTAEGLRDPARWSTPAPILSKDTTLAPHHVIGLGEPTVGVYRGVTELYFVYGTIRGFDPITGFPDLDMQAGVVRKQ